MEVYAGLFLVALGIGYLTIRFVHSRSAMIVEKDGETVSSPIWKQSHTSKQKDSRGNPSATTSRGSALVADANHKPWGW